MAIAAVAALRRLARLESRQYQQRAGRHGFAGSITCALFLQRFVEAAKSWLHVDIYGWTPIGESRRARKAANARPRARSTSCWANAMDDPRLTPARPDLAAKYLEGKVRAARFVDGEEFEISDAIAPLREATVRRRRCWRRRR